MQYGRVGFVTEWLIFNHKRAMFLAKKIIKIKRLSNLRVVA